eukprot:354770-Chlamydomonas_euryale.AAC.5
MRLRGDAGRRCQLPAGGNAALKTGVQYRWRRGLRRTRRCRSRGARGEADALSYGAAASAGEETDALG